MAEAQALDEYKIAAENMRWYSNIRFAQLTLFVALTTLMLSRLYAGSPPLPSSIALALKVLGGISAAVFGYMEIRADEYWSHYMRRAVELEKALGYAQYTSRPQRRLRTTHVLRILFLSVLLFWVTSLFVP
jgi:hypothetical protein